MHYTVSEWVHSVITYEDVWGKRVVEAGSYNVNGSVRSFIQNMHPLVYIGTDIREGPDVDMVMDAGDLPAMLGNGFADLVISTEMMEHVRNWRSAMNGLIAVLREGGVLVVTTRSPGFGVHDFPEDHWRYTTNQMKDIMEGAGLVVEDLATDPIPGVFCRSRKPVGWAWPADTAARWEAITPSSPIR